MAGESVTRQRKHKCEDDSGDEGDSWKAEDQECCVTFRESGRKVVVRNEDQEIQWWNEDIQGLTKKRKDH